MTVPANETEHLPVASGSWQQRLRQYRKPGALRGLLELAITAIPFALAWFTMLFALYRGYLWLYALLLLPAAGLLVRLFMIQHDCGHGAFLPGKRSNDWIGRAISILTLAPYDHWRRCHAAHHATSGNLNHRGVGDIDTLTVAEYLARSRWSRFCYRLYRHPLMMFGVGPLYFFGLKSRLPFGFMRKGWKPWISTMTTNLAIAIVAALAIWSVGLWPFLLIQLPIVVVGATVGVWLFYVQHQFEQTHWAADTCWSVQDAALQGSSYYDLPRVLRWFTANIGVHHVHHLSSRIPYYRLPDVLRDYPELRNFGRLTLLDSLNSVRLALWDENDRRLISFKEIYRAGFYSPRQSA
jgi:omega-6 fatty acid desaturase (delta-12 desaturase)